MSVPEPTIVTAEFAERAGFTLARSPAEVMARIDAIRSEDAAGLALVSQFGTEVLLDFLTWGQAQRYFDEEFVRDVEGGVRPRPPRHTRVEDHAREFMAYMALAWRKAMEQRGVPASRSIIKLGEWLWALGRDDLFELIHRDDLFAPYGAAALVAVCDELGASVPPPVRNFAADPRNATPGWKPDDGAIEENAYEVFRARPVFIEAEENPMAEWGWDAEGRVIKPGDLVCCGEAVRRVIRGGQILEDGGPALRLNGVEPLVPEGAVFLAKAP